MKVILGGRKAANRVVFADGRAAMWLGLFSMVACREDDPTGSDAQPDAARSAVAVTSASAAPAQVFEPPPAVIVDSGFRFHLVAKANAARSFAVSGGYFVSDGDRFLSAPLGSPITTGVFPEPEQTTDALVIDSASGAFGDNLWIAYHYRETGSIGDAKPSGLVRLAGRRLAPLARLPADALVVQAGEETLVIQKPGTSPTGATLLSELVPPARLSAIELDEAGDVAAGHCLRSFEPKRGTGLADGTIVAVGRCVLDGQSDARLKVAVITVLPLSKPATEADPSTADAGPDEPSPPRRSVVAPLPATDVDDVVTGLYARSKDEVWISMASPRHDKPPALFLGGGTSFHTELVPFREAILSMSGTEGLGLVLATEWAVFRLSPEKAFSQINLPQPADVALQVPPNVSHVWAASPDEFWLTVAHGTRIVRSVRDTDGGQVPQAAQAPPIDLRPAD